MENRTFFISIILAASILAAVSFGFSIEEAEAAVPKGESINLHVPAIPDIELMPLTAQGIDSRLALLQKAHDTVQSYHDKFAYLVSPDDPDLVKLKNAIALYDAQHEKLLSMRPAIVQQEFASTKPEYSDYHKNFRAGQIRTKLSAMTSVGELHNTTVSLNAIDSLVDKARPGTILFTDTEGKFGPKGGRFWYPLEGGANPQNPSGPKLPRLISFKYAGASELPLSTSHALYELQLTLKDRMSLDTPLGAVEDEKSKPYVTAGSRDTYKHADFGGHSDLSGIDFRSIDTTPAGVAEVLADSAKVRNSHLWFEIPGSKKNPADLAKLLAFQESAVLELSKHGYSEEKAWEFIKAHTRLVSGANATHFHFDTNPRPPILAPNTMIAQG